MAGSDVCDHAGVGFAIFARRVISPKSLIPHFQNCDLIFITKAEYCQWKSQLIVENSLGFNCTVFFFSTEAITSFVLVFPTLPVIPTTGISSCSR